MDDLGLITGARGGRSTLLPELLSRMLGRRRWQRPREPGLRRHLRRRQREQHGGVTTHRGLLLQKRRGAVADGLAPAGCVPSVRRLVAIPRPQQRRASAVVGSVEDQEQTEMMCGLGVGACACLDRKSVV